MTAVAEGRRLLGPGWAFGELRAGLTQIPGDERPDDLGATPIAYELAKPFP